MLRIAKIAPVFLLAAALSSAMAPEPDFNREVRPIFEQHCYECHGPTKAEGGLRLTSRVEAFTPGDYGIEVLTPGDASLSLLFERVTEADPSERMPHKRDALSADKIDVLRRWIDAGAQWPEEASRHWAYVTPVRPPVPAAGHPVDAFVNARLDEQNVVAAPRAAPARLLRRLYLDLIGLPPTIDEVDAFVADPSPEHYDRVVDRLLASPRFGERWAVPWLDAARYSDSNGFQKDNFRHTWGYRDWVIDAINEDMPFDQFTIEQLAGDLLPEPTVEQLTATGFHRGATVNIEVGVDPEEDRVRQVTDRVNTTAMVWLGSSLECAQCHDHKFDSFTQREYYELFAFFNSSPPDVEQLGTKGVTYQVGGPEVELPDTRERTRQLAGLKREIRQLKREFASVNRTATFPDWAAERRRQLEEPIRWKPVEIVEFHSSADESYELGKNGTITLRGAVPDTVEHRIRFKASSDRMTAIRVEALPSRGKSKRPRRPRPMLSAVELWEASDPKTSQGSRVPLWINQLPADPRLSYLWLTIDGNDVSSWAMRGAPAYLFGPVDSSVELELVLQQNFGFGRTIDRLRVTATDAPHELVVLPPDIVKLLELPSLTRAQKVEIYQYYRKHGLEAPSSLQRLSQQAFGYRPPTSLVMAELDEPRESRILLRGSHLSPGEVVKPSTPASLHPMAGDLPRNRLGLARWLVDPENPLVGRVTVNRWWAALFGAGIVRTPEEFGTRGERPSHPGLLDWLASEFVSTGWSRKHILRLLVTSDAYKRTTRASPEVWERDPDNRLLARQARRRLDAEFIRDNALAVSGLLVEGGRGVRAHPPQPEGLWKHVGSTAAGYRPSWGDDRFRRGVYTVHRRSAPYPSFVNFDAPDRSTCIVQRSHTTTPLQALTLLNDEAFVEMTMALAARILDAAEAADDRGRLEYAVRLVLARSPREGEVDTLAKLLAVERERLRAHADTATRLLEGLEGYRAPEGLDPIELAAWYSVASTLLNLDETITRS